MLEQSKEYLAAVKSPQRQVNAKFTLNNRVFGGTKLAKLDYDQAIVSGTSYTFGGAYVARLTMKIKELVEGIQEMMPATAEIGISVDGAMEYNPIGQFFVTDIELDRNTNSTKLKLQDGFCKLNGEYQSRLSYPTTARAVFSEICQICNISTMPMNIPDTIILGTKLEKTSYREAIKYIAQLVGSYAIFNRKGQLEFRNIQKLSYRVNRDNYVMGGFKRKEIQFRLNGIECEVSNNQKLITGTSSGNVAKLNNPWMTQMYLDELFSKVQGFQFYPYSLNFQGDPCLDVGDWIEVEYAKGEYFQAPILVQKISFDGGLSSEISANTLGVSDVVYQYKSPLARKVEFIEGRLSADGLSQVYSGLDEPNHEHLKKGDTWFKPNGTDVEIWMYNGEKWEEVASPEVFRQLQADFEALDKQAKEAFEQVDTLVQESPEAQRLANDAYSKANSAVTSATNASSTANSALTKASDATSVANSASQNANNAVASANSAVNTASQAKSNADKAIADVAALTQTVSTQSTRIDQTSSRIDQIASGITEVGNRLDGMSIGDENLINLSEIIAYNNATIDTSNYVKRGEVILTKSSGQTYSGLYFNFYNDAKPETYYVFSYDITALDDHPFNTIRGHMDTGFYTMKFYVDGTDTSMIYQNVYTFSNSSARKHHIEVYIKVKNEMTNDRRIFIQPNHATGEREKYKIENLKLIEGNKYTNGWSAAPSDIKSEIDDTNTNIANNYYAKTTVDSKLSTAVSGITAQYTKDISTKLSNYYDKATMDRRLTIGDVGIETYVKNTQSQLSNLQFSGRNYVLDSDKYIETTTGDTMRNFDFSVDILKARNKTFTVSIDIELENAVFRRVGFEPSLIFSNGHESWYGIWLNYSGKPMTLKTRIYQTWTIADLDVTRYAQHGIYIQGFVSGRIKIGRPALIEGNGKVWSPSPEDMATLTQYTQVKQLADRISSTVYDSASGLVTKTNQLAGKYAIQNLNSYGDVLSSLNLNGGNVRIKGGLIDLDGNVRIQDGFVKNLKANSILANEITAKATNIINARIVNIDASYITSGTLSANTISGGKLKSLNNNMEINLDSGDINFYARNKLQGTINNTGQSFYLEGRYLGYIGSVNKIRQQSPSPIVLCSENDNFISFMYKNKYGSYNNSVFIDPLGITGSEGVRFLTDVYIEKVRPAGWGEDVEALEFAASYYNNYKYPFFGNSSRNSGLLYGGNWLYFKHDGYIYSFEDVRKLINAFVGLGTIQIPRAIASDGTVDRWTTITI